MLRILDSQTLWTVDIRTIGHLLNALDSELISFTERDITDTLNVLYDNSHSEELDFDEFLYQLAVLSKVSLAFHTDVVPGLGPWS